MTTSILRIPVRKGAEDEFARTFANLKVFDHASRIEGFRAGRLFRPAASGEPFVVTAEWDGPEGFLAPTSTWIVTAVAAG